MTIGDIVRSKKSHEPNDDFLILKKTRDMVAKGLGRDPEQLELSMGMSSDFEQAIKLGATNVRFVFESLQSTEFFFFGGGGYV